uniref:NADH:ubiquinone reductase (H(+)-translocating) n=1 Tax=Paraspadella gotoi TaxID=34758 RepID=Q6E0V7_PARGO|nr:NADH dehydrogenase subunit 5 [Paraspadella gotoi]AAT12174.1 NADH dehydrogenase subunit 5 [Paraspadella gotoi]
MMNSYILVCMIIIYLMYYFQGIFSIVMFSSLKMSLISDSYSFFFFLTLTVVSSSVFLWTDYYMSNSIFLKRFMSLVILFVVSMWCLIFCPNWIFSMVGWDGLGVTSFLLVIFFKTRKALGSGLITAFTNRIGDCFFLLSIPLFFFNGWYFLNPTFFWFFVCFFLLSLTKSAQVPFSTWLPSAMAAPTPVSALVHSSTLVTAGIYLLIRYNFLNLYFLSIVGTFTMIMAGFSACSEIDVKKLVALSTLSQLGVMFVSLGLSQKKLAFYHLLTHALFKALLFMCVGIVIHNLFGSQEFREKGTLGAAGFSPIGFFIISNFALMGFPYMSGFFSKDSILEFFFYKEYSFFLMLLFLFGIGLTTMYSFYLINCALMSLFSKKPYLKVLNAKYSLKLPLSILSVGAIAGGYFLTLGFLDISIFMNYVDKILPVFCINLGLLLGMYVHSFENPPTLHTMWGLSSPAQMGSTPLEELAKLEMMDKGWFDWFSMWPLVAHFTALVYSFLSSLLMLLGILFIIL